MFRLGNAVRAKSSKRAFRWLGFGRVWRFSANPIVRIRAWLGSGLGRAPRGGGIPSMSNGVGHAFCPITRISCSGGVPSMSNRSRHAFLSYNPGLPDRGNGGRMEGSALAGPGMHVLTYSPTSRFDRRDAKEAARRRGELRPGNKEGMTRCAVHRFC